MKIGTRLNRVERLVAQHDESLAELRVAQNTLKRRTGISFPTRISPLEFNGEADNRRVLMGTGIPASAMAAAYFHEVTHMEHGDARPMTDEGVRRTELRADRGAGKKLVEAFDLDDKRILGYVDFLQKYGGSSDHGSAKERISATLDGVIDGLLERDDLYGI
jgi:hypothetical protein